MIVNQLVKKGRVKLSIAGFRFSTWRAPPFRPNLESSPKNSSGSATSNMTEGLRKLLTGKLENADPNSTSATGRPLDPSPASNFNDGAREMNSSGLGNIMPRGSARMPLSFAPQTTRSAENSQNGQSSARANQVLVSCSPNASAVEKAVVQLRNNSLLRGGGPHFVEEACDLVSGFYVSSNPLSVSGSQGDSAKSIAFYISPDNAAWLLNLFIDENQYVYARHLYISIKECILERGGEITDGLTLNPDKFTKFISMCEFHGDFIGIKQLILDFENCGITLNTEILTIYLSACLSELEKNNSTVNLHEKIEVIPFDSLKSINSIVQVLEEYENRGVPLSHDALHMIGAHLISVMNFDACEGFLFKFREELGELTFQNLVRFYFYQTIYERKMTNRPMKFFNNLLDLDKPEFHPNPETIALILEGYNKMTELNNYQAIVDYCLITGGVVPSREAFGNLLLMQISSHRLLEAYKTLATMLNVNKTPTTDHWYRFFMGVLHSSAIPISENYETHLIPVLQRMIEDNIQPYVEIKYALARCVTKLTPTPLFMQYFKNLVNHASSQVIDERARA